METMNIWALNGHRVTVTEESAKNGYDYDKKRASELIGKILTVEYTSVSSSSTSVFFKEFPGKSFNSVNFVDVDKQSKDKDKMHDDYKRWNLR